jgi:hypothetical protein
MAVPIVTLRRDMVLVRLVPRAVNTSIVLNGEPPAIKSIK